MAIIILSYNVIGSLIGSFLFIILFWFFWINIGYIWHRIFETHQFSFFLGLKVFFSSLKRFDIKSEHNPIIQSTKRNILLWLVLRWFLFILSFLSLLISLLNLDSYNVLIFALLTGFASLCGVIIEIEIIYVNQGNSGLYGRILAIYELIGLFTLILWSWDLQSFSLITISNNIWTENTNWKLAIQIILLLIILFSTSLSSDYLGYKKLAPFDTDNQKMDVIPLRLRTFYIASQSFYQILIITFLALINLNFASRFISNSSVSVSRLASIFLILCFLFVISVLILSVLSYKMKFNNLGVYIPLLIVMICLILILIYSNLILSFIKIS